MPDLIVHRHGERWAVLEAGAESPTKEFATREEAELTARNMADGGRVEVLEDDPSGLREDPNSGEPARHDDLTTAAAEEIERVRSRQLGP